ncbi:hypothetical protein [Sphingomonas sp.]|jgi:uncharacterized membrane protein YgcG|uniref:hypothetical protein n=1 Tax=Sphingomonas sp. TaxID=28214 RepID=UPI002DF67D5E|nr:hypothetical protein [Sphingomonas sp.]
MDGVAETVEADVKDQKARQRSTIAFPYMDLKAAADMAEAVFANVAGGECEYDQLAAWTGQSAKSSTFRVQVYAARTFGLLAGEGGKHRVTELGKAIVDPQQAREAKVRAFLSVPLYLAIFEKFKGGVLPPTAALEREIEGLGVAPKQKDRARQVFERSAEYAGFFEHGRNRLVQPGISGAAKVKEEDDAGSSGHSGGSNGGGGGGGGSDSELDPLIAALIKKLPKAGDTWTAASRVTWLRMAAMAFGMVYGEEDEITIEIKDGA